MKNFGKKWFISASSGLLGKILFFVLVLGGGVVGSAYLLPEESAITKAISFLITFFVMTVTLQFFFRIETFKEWARERRQDRIRELELENEQQKLKNENLKLELELQEKQPLSENDE